MCQATSRRGVLTAICAHFYGCIQPPAARFTPILSLSWRPRTDVRRCSSGAPAGRPVDLARGRPRVDRPMCYCRRRTCSQAMWKIDRVVPCVAADGINVVVAVAAAAAVAFTTGVDKSHVGLDKPVLVLALLQIQVYWFVAKRLKYKINIKHKWNTVRRKSGSRAG